jgi:hypothetical protein
VPFVVSDAGALAEVAGPAHRWVARRADDADLARVLSAALRQAADERSADVAAARARWVREYSPAAGEQRLAGVLAGLGLAVTR